MGASSPLKGNPSTSSKFTRCSTTVAAQSWKENPSSSSFRSAVDYTTENKTYVLFSVIILTWLILWSFLILFETDDMFEPNDTFLTKQMCSCSEQYESKPDTFQYFTVMLHVIPMLHKNSNWCPSLALEQAVLQSQDPCLLNAPFNQT